MIFKYNPEMIYFTKKICSMKKKSGFTLSEVLLTIGIIGLLASMLIPVIMNKVQEAEYKTGYRKAYSDLNQAFNSVAMENDFVDNGTVSGGPGIKSNFDKIKAKFKIVKECDNSLAEGCWVDACMNGADCWSSLQSENTQGKSWGFIDASGRAWINYKRSFALWPIVDINGTKLPNRMGRDRFAFKLNDNTGGLYGTPYKITIIDDCIEPAPTYCSLGNCYYKSWLYK